MTYRISNSAPLLALIGAGIAASAARADIIVLGPSKDNTLIEIKAGDLSDGADDGVYSGRLREFGNGAFRRGLLAFDLTADVPAGSVITSASLTLTLILAPDDFSRVHSLHRLLADWGEGASAGGGMGAPAEEGDATWFYTFFPDEFWANPGGDFAPTPSASLDVPSVPGPYTWSATEMVADVQGWVDDPSSNYGWLLIGDESVLKTARKFASKENELVEWHPVLTIEFTPPTPCIGDLEPGDGNGVVDVDDLLALINSWGECTCEADIAPDGGNGVVDVDDLLALINDWGPCD